MKITMKEAILAGKDFEFEGGKYIVDFSGNVSEGIDRDKETITWALTNQDKEVEVEDNYWDADGRAIRELEISTEYWYIEDYMIEKAFYSKESSHIKSFFIGNCFKDKESAEAELERLKQKQKERMGK